MHEPRPRDDARRWRVAKRRGLAKADWDKLGTTVERERRLTDLEARLLAAVAAERRAWGRYTRKVSAQTNRYPADGMKGCRALYVRWHSRRVQLDALADEYVEERGRK